MRSDPTAQPFWGRSRYGEKGAVVGVAVYEMVLGLLKLCEAMCVEGDRPRVFDVEGDAESSLCIRLLVQGPLLLCVASLQCLG